VDEAVEGGEAGTETESKRDKGRWSVEGGCGQLGGGTDGNEAIEKHTAGHEAESGVKETEAEAETDRQTDRQTDRDEERERGSGREIRVCESGTREGGEGGDYIEEQEDTGFRESGRETREREAREYIEEEEDKGFLERGRLVEDAGHCVSAFSLCVCVMCALCV
jgi:hypothetical protein